jgi:HEAT repeat protein
VDVRIGTAAILGQIGPEAADAVQDLKNLLNDPQLGEAAASALKQIDNPASTEKD